MPLFREMGNTQAFLKAGFLGSQGSGKTWTATEIMIGLMLLGRERGIDWAQRPILFFDTETGSDWVAPKIRAAGLKVQVAKTRSFSDLLDGVQETELSGGGLIIDSITHVWREFCEAYMRKRNRSRLDVSDWTELKAGWSRFTDLFVGSQCHIALLGRLGYEYDVYEDDRGKRQMDKSGVKMKAESEMGYEPSLLVMMESRPRSVPPGERPDIKKLERVAHVLKDRSGLIDGQEFVQPTFADFRPHIDFLNLGGMQGGVDTSRTSDNQFEPDGEAKWMAERHARDVALEEIEAEMVRKWPSTSNADKAAKADMVEKLFGTRSWTAVQKKPLASLKEARNKLWHETRGHGYGVKPQAEPIADAPPPAGEPTP